jgi:hypothetical protein
LTIPIFEFADKRTKTERSLLCPLLFLEPPVSEKINGMMCIDKILLDGSEQFRKLLFFRSLEWSRNPG